MSITGHGHVAVFAFPFGTHAAPLLTLVKRLASAAPTTKFSFFSTAQSNLTNFPATRKLTGYDNITPYDITNGVPEGHVFSGNPLEPIGFFLKATPVNFRIRLDEVVAESGLKISCLITDALFGFPGEFAEELGVPWVAFWTAGACSILMHIYTDVIRSNLALHGNTENTNQTLSFLPSMSAIHATDLPMEVTGSLDEPFAHLLHKMGLQVQRSAAVVLNSFEEIDPIVTDDLKSKVQKVLNIGFFTLASPTPSCSDKNSCISWLENQKEGSVAYLSFGSMLTPPPHELEALAEALEAKRVPFLWSFRDNSKRDLLKGHFERMGGIGKVVPWAPQLQILKHSSVGVFITHCGWNSVAESIGGGVPMICRPFFGDQMINRRCIEDVWGIGVSVKGDIFTKEGIMDALDRVLCVENGKKIRENIKVLKEKAIKAVGDEGSSTENFKTLLDVVLNTNKP